MRLFTIKRDIDNSRLSPEATRAVAASTQLKLKKYHSRQGKSEFSGPALTIADTQAISAISGSVEYMKVEVNEDAPLSAAIPFSIH